jgi:hypothetical protein
MMKVVFLLASIPMYWCIWIWNCVNVSMYYCIAFSYIRTKCILRGKYAYQCMTVSAYNICLYWRIYVCTVCIAMIYLSQSYWNWQKFYSKRKLWREIRCKKCFLKQNKIFEVKVNDFCFHVIEKKVFPSFRLEAIITLLKRSEKLEVKRSEKCK